MYDSADKSSAVQTRKPPRFKATQVKSTPIKRVIKIDIIKKLASQQIRTIKTPSMHSKFDIIRSILRATTKSTLEPNTDEFTFPPRTTQSTRPPRTTKSTPQPETTRKLRTTTTESAFDVAGSPTIAYETNSNPYIFIDDIITLIKTSTTPTTTKRIKLPPTTEPTDYYHTLNFTFTGNEESVEKFWDAYFNQTEETLDPRIFLTDPITTLSDDQKRETKEREMRGMFKTTEAVYKPFYDWFYHVLKDWQSRCTRIEALENLRIVVDYEIERPLTPFPIPSTHMNYFMYVKKMNEILKLKKHYTDKP